MFTRNSGATLAWLLSVSVVMSGGAFAQSKTIEVADGVYAFDNSKVTGYNSLFVTTGDGVVVIEPANPNHAKALLQAIRSVTDEPIKYLLHSHNHWDHSKGGQVFKDEGAIIMAHKAAYDWMKANPHPQMLLPDEGWEGNRKDIRLGDKTIELHYLGMNHGLGTTIFRVSEQKVIYIADLVTQKRVLFTIVPDFNMKETLRSLEEIEALDFDKAVFSHGIAVGGKMAVTEARQFIVDLQAAIRAEFAKRTPFMQIPSTVKLPKYQDWGMYEEWLPMNIWRVMLEDWMGPWPWIPESARN